MLLIPTRRHVKLGWRMVGQPPLNERAVLLIVVGISLPDGPCEHLVEGLKASLFDGFAESRPIVGEKFILLRRIPRSLLRG